MGRFLLTFVLAIVGIVAALPLGILLALGRRSELPVVRSFSILYIELWRGTPLITVLFMASVLLPLFFASGVDFDKVLRALIGITLFQSAYTAEAIRGGLQAIPKGQFEAADALGLSYWKKTIFITLPQALKISIPGIVNTFIELFKDTSLVSIIGLADLLNMSQTAALSMQWRGYDTEAYIFAAFMYSGSSVMAFHAIHKISKNNSTVAIATKYLSGRTFRMKKKKHKNKKKNEKTEEKPMPRKENE